MQLATLKTLSLVALGLLSSAIVFTQDTLPSWNDGPVKQSIVRFVQRVTTPGSPDFVPLPARIATFDNDGTLWSEQPMYFQAFFIFDRIRALAPQHPEWKTKEPFASVLKADVRAALAGGEHSLMEMAMATHAGTTTEEFDKIVTDWIATAKHPSTGNPYTEMVYQPMLELLSYLRARGFKTCIVSGGGIEFMRPWTERIYGVPPEQFIGSSIKTKFEMREDKPVLVRLPEINFVDDGAGKPVGIQIHIGRRPIAAFGNSDGDLQMLQWTAVNRVSRSGEVIGPDERVTALQGLKASTINGAFHREESSKATLEAGKLADLVILDKNPLKVDPMTIKDIRVVETI